MDYVYFVLFILVLGGLIYLLSKIDARTKNKHKIDAYRLLENPDPNPRKVKDTVKGLRLYSGRLKKDKESAQLIKDLLEKHGHLLQ